MSLVKCEMVAEIYTDAAEFPEQGVVRFGYVIFFENGMEVNIQEATHIKEWGIDYLETTALLMALRRAEKLLEKGVVDKVTIYCDNLEAIKKCSPLVPPGAPIEILKVSSSGNKAHSFLRGTGK